MVGCGRPIFSIPTTTIGRINIASKDACVEDYGGGGITLAKNVLSKEEVDRALSHAVLAGGTLLKAACDTEWEAIMAEGPTDHVWSLASKFNG